MSRLPSEAEYSDLEAPFITKELGSSFQVVAEEVKSMAGLAFTIILSGVLLYPRSMISMLFLGRLSDLALAGGSLAVGFANITGYSVLSGLAMGIEPICGQAYGAGKHSVLGLALQRCILLLLSASVPITLLWMSVRPILLLFRQDPEIASAAQAYLLYSIPDLFIQSLLHPIRIYLRAQSITLPLTLCSITAITLHVPINYLLVSRLDMGMEGVALSGVWTNFNLLVSLVVYIFLSRLYEKTWAGLSFDCFRNWGFMLRLSIPSCLSVCLEWWWYEIMILLCGLLSNPTVTVASMGILIQTTALLYIFPSSLASSVSTRVGNELGAGRPHRARLAALVGLFGSFIIGAIALGFTVLVRDSWAGLFTKNKEIAALTALVLPIIGLCEVGNSPQTTGCGVLRGTARPNTAASINLASFYFVGMPVAIGLGFWAGLDFIGLWLGLLAAQACCVVTMLVIVGATNWTLEAKRAEELTRSEVFSDNDDSGGGLDPLKVVLAGEESDRCSSCFPFGYLLS